MITKIIPAVMPTINTAMYDQSIISIMPTGHLPDLGDGETYLEFGGILDSSKLPHVDILDIHEINLPYKYVHTVRLYPSGRAYLTATVVTRIHNTKPSRKVYVPIWNHGLYTEDTWKAGLYFKSAFMDNSMYLDDSIFEAYSSILYDHSRHKLQPFITKSATLLSFEDINRDIENSSIENAHSSHARDVDISRILHKYFGHSPCQKKMEEYSDVIQCTNSNNIIDLEHVLRNSKYNSNIRLKYIASEKEAIKVMDDKIASSSPIADLLGGRANSVGILISALLECLEKYRVGYIDLTLEKQSDKDEQYITKGNYYQEDINTSKMTNKLFGKNDPNWVSSLKCVINSYVKENFTESMKKGDTISIHYYDHCATIDLKLNNREYKYVIPVLMCTNLLPVFNQTN